MLLFKRLHPAAVLPTYATEGAAGMDVCAVEPTILPPGKWGLVRTGLAVRIPAHYELQVRPRSGLAFRYGVTVLNSPGTIDSDYRGEIGVVLINHNPVHFRVNVGERIAQLVLAPVARTEILEVSDLDETERGEGGFGSTGM